jgi:hypothetical protein
VAGSISFSDEIFSDAGIDPVLQRQLEIKAERDRLREQYMTSRGLASSGKGKRPPGLYPRDPSIIEGMGNLAMRMGLDPRTTQKLEEGAEFTPLGTLSQTFAADNPMDFAMAAMPAAKKAKAVVPKPKGKVTSLPVPGRGPDPAIDKILSPEDRIALTTDYPDPGPPVIKTDPKKGTTYEGKGITDLGKRATKARALIQKDIDAGNYTPYYNLLERDYADPSSYGLPDVSPTRLNVPKKAETYAKHQAIVQDPEVSARLLAAEAKGAAMPNAGKWYGMKQWQDDYIKDYGREEGLRRFDEDFATPMAATTGGSSPRQNLVNTGYVNLQRERGLPVEEESKRMPTFVGGGKIGGASNMQAANKYSVRGEPIDPKGNPKRFDFRARFLGKTKTYNVIDDQVMQGFKPGGPGSPEWYGMNTMEIDRLSDIANRMPEEAQENIWYGLKSEKDPSITSQQPMMQDVNEAIERTSRITGYTPDQVAKLIRARKIPIYSVAGLGVLAELLAKNVNGGQGNGTDF